MKFLPLIFISIFSLFSINSFADNLADSTSTKLKSRKTELLIYPEHKVSVDIISYIGGEVLVQYDYLFHKQKVAVRIPFGYVFSDIGRNMLWIKSGRRAYLELKSEKFYNEKAVHTGAEWMIFLNPPKKFRGYVAPGVGAYVFWADREVSIREIIEDKLVIVEQFKEKKTSFNLGGNINLGMQGITKRKLSFGAEAGFGLGKPIGYNFGHKWMFNYRISFFAGYHFGKRHLKS